MSVFVSRPMKFVTLHWKNGDLPKRVVDFPLESDPFRNKIMKIVEDFDEKSDNNNGRPWKSSRILGVKPNFFMFSLFIIFLNCSFSHFDIFSIFSFFHCFHFFIFSFFSFICSFFHFLHFFHFFIFFISFIFSFFLLLFFFFLLFSVLFSFSFLGCSKSNFFWPQLLPDFLYHFFEKKSIFRPVSGATPSLWALFSFFSLFFHVSHFFFAFSKFRVLLEKCVFSEHMVLHGDVVS